ncbi:transporter [Cytophagaceae bacterium YF14B1]|uniref:Transporter n=1 Tax=Xanthocytophaga flava TaxID=3048013 RepID=A0AAE3UD48_9BACT|nr:transporter [Xanthocytophaga flavus]MDJ1485524.1 transporter [Xanthocytophaga flavus]
MNFIKHQIGIATIGFFLACIGSVSGQESIATDRPDQTECPSIVPKGMFQIESGFQYEFDKSDTSRIQNITYNTSLIKYGLSEYAEFRLIVEYMGCNSIYKRETSVHEREASFSPVAIGMKLRICEESGLIPKTSLICHVDLPAFKCPENQVNTFVPRYRFTMSHTLSDKSSLSYNIGSEWNAVTTIPTHIYTLTLGRSLSEKWGMYIEGYGFITKNQPADHRFDGGFTYLVTNDCQLDVSGGFGLTPAAPDSFIGVGCSWRFKK